MPRYEYKVVPAPKKPGKVKGVRGTENKFAAALCGLMNEYGADGWEYQRTDTLPCEERQGLTGRSTTFQNMLVFRREIIDVAQNVAPQAAATLALPMPEAAPDSPQIQASAQEQTHAVDAAPAETEEPASRPAFLAPLAAESAPTSEPQGIHETAATFVRAEKPRFDIDPEPVPETSPESPSVPSFRSASLAAPSPRLSAAAEVPEGNAPAIRFRPADNIAAQ